MRTRLLTNRSLSLIALFLSVLIVLLSTMRINTSIHNTTWLEVEQLPATRLGEILMHTTGSSPPRGVALVMVSYTRMYSLREAYEAADLVILGKIIYTEHYTWNIKRPYMGKALTFEEPYSYHRVKVIEVFKGNPISDIIIVAQFGGLDSKGRLVIVPEDPPMEEGELVILFLKGPREKGDFVKYPGREYCHMSVFGRFKVIDGKVYSAMYFLPEEKNGISCRSIAERLLKGLEGYREVNGITIEEFLKLIRS